uniref:Uncharacterized protein n=1 Tax=Globisporangium ultimum (strain ATCC 200006 / CBS 805.95 / DAOM BR144) TaxID=431595 RepID=K3X401_GLOUD
MPLDALDDHERGAPEHHGPHEPQHREEQHVPQPRAVLPAVWVQLRLAVDLDGTAARRPGIFEPPEDDRRWHIAQCVDDERVGGDRHGPTRRWEELHHRDGLGRRQCTQKQETARQETQERVLDACKQHHDQRQRFGDERKVKQRRYRHVAAPVLGLALQQPVDKDAAQGCPDRASDHDDPAKHHRHLRLGLKEPQADEDHGAEHAQRRERECVRGMTEHHQRERRVAEDGPPLGHKRSAALGLEAGLLVYLVTVILGHDVELRGNAHQTRENERDHERTFEEERGAPTERRRRQTRAVDVPERRADGDRRQEDAHVQRAFLLRRVRVDERRRVTLERGLANAREDAAEEQHVVALHVLREAAHDHSEHPHGHAERDRAERPVRERQVPEHHPRDERGREDAQVQRLLSHVDVQRARDEVLELLGRARDDAAVKVVH